MGVPPPLPPPHVGPPGASTVGAPSAYLLRHLVDGMTASQY